ncbi:MAG: LLM class flavin-dependent oxidoreductase [Thermoleophilia bacterium]|nr:LLM class flavin-dependent oxidoreductase [Thermoleophilia bacterium]
MRLALMIEGQEGVSWEDWLSLARACEEHGVEALFRSDHYLSGTDREREALDAWAVLPALAAQTTRLELGTLVSPVTFRAAAVLANASATANEIGAGRISLGMGTGWMEAEHQAFGFAFPAMEERLALLREQIQAVRRYWDGRPHPHVIVGGSGRSGTVEPAAKWADEYNTIFATPEECAERRRKLVRACEREGRPAIPLSLMTACAIGRTPEEARERIRRRLERAGQTRDPDEYKAVRGAASVLGTIEEATEHLRAYERAGVERVMLQHLDHRDLEMVALIGRELAPAVA